MSSFATALDALTTPPLTRDQLTYYQLHDFEIIDRNGDPWLVRKRRTAADRIELWMCDPDTRVFKWVTWVDAESRFFADDGEGIDDLNHYATHLRLV